MVLVYLCAPLVQPVLGGECSKSERYIDEDRLDLHDEKEEDHAVSPCAAAIDEMTSSRIIRVTVSMPCLAFLMDGLSLAVLGMQSPGRPCYEQCTIACLRRAKA